MRAMPMPSACARCASSKHSPIKNLISYYQREAIQKEVDRRLGYSRAYRTNRHSWHNGGAPAVPFPAIHAYADAARVSPARCAGAASPQHNYLRPRGLRAELRRASGTRRCNKAGHRRIR